MATISFARATSPRARTVRLFVGCGVVIWYVTATLLAFHFWRAATILNDSGPLRLSGTYGTVITGPADIGQRVMFTGSLLNRSGLAITVSSVEVFAVGPSSESWLEVVDVSLDSNTGPGESTRGHGLGRVPPHGGLPFTAVLEVVAEPRDWRRVQFFAARTRYSYLGLPMTAESTGIWLIQAPDEPEGG